MQRLTEKRGCRRKMAPSAFVDTPAEAFWQMPSLFCAYFEEADSNDGDTRITEANAFGLSRESSMYPFHRRL